ncbi:unnamed protein product [Hymenolepis diminuta]|uniref:Uncharacterized protein n=1 Tax=Hymenolepis diminuta TaxID=6216 RepID=A0A0R3SXY5_HYMDI|nr:unnamed protein product [Hymenolepis diminuta]
MARRGTEDCEEPTDRFLLDAFFFLKRYTGVHSQPRMFRSGDRTPITWKTVHECFYISRWSLLPPMIEERSRCAAVNIPDSGILFIGGIGRKAFLLRSTELLTQRSGEVGGGGDEKWQWLPYTPMNEEHNGNPLAVYFQRRVYVVGFGERVHKMEMLDVTAGGQWTSLTSFGLSRRLRIHSMARVGNELFMSC